MTARMRDWWRIRSAREQRLLLVMLGLAAVTVAWLLVIRPLGDLLADARADAARAAVRASETRAQADAIAAIERARPAVPRMPIDAVLTQAVAEAGFTGARVAQGDGGATVRIDSARPPAFFGWIEAMENRRGLIVDRLSARPAGDRTLAATVTFRERGR